MRKHFPGYYRPSDDEFKKLWKDCIFVFDTNVLFHFYRYTLDTRESLFDIIKRFQNRTWLPHQVGMEYSEGRLDVIIQQFKPYTEIERHLTTLSSSLVNAVPPHFRHPFYDELQAFIKSLDRSIEQAKKKLNFIKQKHPDFLVSDDIQENILNIFEGKVGDPYSKEKMNEVIKEIKERYDSKIPPGYMDSGKQSTRPYGDAVIWFQILDYAQACKKPIIFVTDDNKEDWWLKHEGKTIGPRPELIQEMQLKASVVFYMYKPAQFMEHAQTLLKLHSSPDIIKEVREISKQSESPLNPILLADIESLYRGTSGAALNKMLSDFSKASALNQKNFDTINKMLNNASISNTAKLLDSWNKTNYQGLLGYNYPDLLDSGPKDFSSSPAADSAALEKNQNEDEDTDLNGSDTSDLSGV